MAVIVTRFLRITLQGEGVNLREAPLYLKRRVSAHGKFFATYPREVTQFNPGAAKSITVEVQPQVDAKCGAGNPACASTPNIWVSGDWLYTHPEDYDLLTHENVHAVSTYATSACWWWDEGVADLGRAWFGVNNARAGWAMQNPGARDSYKTGYRVTAKFLDWMTRTYGSKIASDILALTRSGSCPDQSFWIARTRSDVDTLWSAYLKTL